MVYCTFVYLGVPTINISYRTFKTSALKGKTVINPNFTRQLNKHEYAPSGNEFRSFRDSGDKTNNWKILYCNQNFENIQKGL